MGREGIVAKVEGDATPGFRLGSLLRPEEVDDHDNDDDRPDDINQVALAHDRPSSSSSLTRVPIMTVTGQAHDRTAQRLANVAGVSPLAPCTPGSQQLHPAATGAALLQLAGALRGACRVVRTADSGRTRDAGVGRGDAQRRAEGTRV